VRTHLGLGQEVEVDEGLLEHVRWLGVGIEAEAQHPQLGRGGDVLLLVVDEQNLRAKEELNKE